MTFEISYKHYIQSEVLFLLETGEGRGEDGANRLRGDLRFVLLLVHTSDFSNVTGVLK